MAITSTSSSFQRLAISLLLVTAAITAVVESQFSADGHPRAGSRLLAARKGDRCEADPTKNVCAGGVKDDGTTQLLYCCKKHCRNVLSDRNNCGRCGNKCGFGQLCCRGNCTAVAYDVTNCGECGAVCPPGQRCEYGACGYA